jgi:Flp pilus assembly protein TadG
MRKTARGAQLIHLAGLMLLIVMFSSLAIDFGYYFAAQNKLQTAADASALAAADELYRSNAIDPLERQDDASSVAEDYVTENEPSLTLDTQDAAFGYVDPATKRYDADQFLTASANPLYAMTGGINAARVTVRRTEGSSNGPLDTIMGKVLGVNNMSTGAYSVAFLDLGVSSITDGGLRPIYGCQAQLGVAMQDGIPENNVIQVYGDHMSVDGNSNIAGCPAPGSGNWGFADLRNCNPDAPGANNTATWFNEGYDGTVSTDQCYSTQSGNFITNTSVKQALDSLIANHTIIIVPLYNAYSGSGSNTQVTVSGFTGFVITGYTAQGPASGRHITGYFTKTLCRNECTTSTNGGGGGLLAKLRLAYQS